MEAGAVSGTLHTASFAASQGKEVFVLPNNIYCENAEGGLKLLEDGCNILFSAESVIDAVSQAIICRKLEYPELNVSDGREDVVKQPREARKNEISMIRLKADRDPDEVTEEEWKALIENELSVKPLDIDSLCHALGIPFYRLSEMLITLQLAGRVVLENGKYSLTFF
jgi:DNA processing protein